MTRKYNADLVDGLAQELYEHDFLLRYDHGVNDDPAIDAPLKWGNMDADEKSDWNKLAIIALDYIGNHLYTNIMNGN